MKIKKCFLSCYVRHINPLNEHPERIKKKKRQKIAEKLNYALMFLVIKKQSLSNSYFRSKI